MGFISPQDHFFNSRFSKTTQVRQQQKGKTFWILMKQRDDEVAVASARPYAIHLHLTPDRDHASNSSLNFLQARCSS